MLAATLGCLGWFCTGAQAAGGSAASPFACVNPSAPYEYGATDANTEVGNSSLTAVLDAAGTLTVLRSAPASYDNQVNFFASGYDQRTGQALAQSPNDGAFVGIRYLLGRTPHFAWLRDWHHAQHYLSSGSPIVLTSYSAPRGTGIFVTDETFATAAPLHRLDASLPSSGPDALVQDFTVTRTLRSAARDIELVAYGNWNPTADQVPYIPLADSGCTAELNTTKQADYDPAHSAVVASWSGEDQSTGQSAASAVAFGWSEGTRSWQVGGDSSESGTPSSDPPDAYTELSARPYQLTGGSQSVAQTTAAVIAAPRFVARHASLRLITTAAASPSAALSQLVLARSGTAVGELAGVKRSWSSLLARAKAPRTTNARVVELARRAVITALLAIDPDSGAIVASPDTQGPYGEDWIRDGSFINAMLDANGYTDLVTRHDLFYAQTQSSATNPIATAPYGNWPMVMYPSGGGPGGPIPYEIDETGYGTWTLYDHAAYLPPGQAKPYLDEVFPAISRAANWLTSCQDPANGFQCMANEDDNEVPTQTLHGALPVLLGLRSAVAAARELAVVSPEVTAWESRAAALQAAIQTLYDPAAHAYREDPSSSSTLPVAFEDGGLMLWPTQLLPYSSPQMRGEASATWSATEASFKGSFGAYEGVALLGLCRASGPHDGLAHRELVQGLRQFMNSTATATGIFGEAWERWGDGHVSPQNDMPHTWEGALFDMSALCVYGS